MTLWMFVPGYSRSVSFIQSEHVILPHPLFSQCQVVPWHKEPIKLQDLQKLVFSIVDHVAMVTV